MSDYNVVSGNNQIPFQNKANTNLMFKFSTIIPIELEYSGYNSIEIEIKSHICLNSIENIVDSKTLYCSTDNIDNINYELNIREILITDTDNLLLYFEFPDNIDVDRYVNMIGYGFNFNFEHYANNIYGIGTIKTVYDSILQNTNKSEKLHIVLDLLAGYH